MKVKISSTGEVREAELSDSVEKSLPENKTGQELVVEADGILEPAIIICEKGCIKAPENKKVVVLRAFTEQDKITKKELKEKAKSFIHEAGSKIFRHGLDMKILDADLSFDQKKLTLYFSAEGRVDFRALVSDMVGDFGKIIRLQQVGPREETKLFGGFGKCGRALCCSTFLCDPENITLEMTEAQDVGSLKSPKLAGSCGKLMCCLSYEADLYKDEKAKLPKIGSQFKSKEGEGRVLSHNIFEGKVTVETKDGKRIEVEV